MTAQDLALLLLFAGALPCLAVLCGVFAARRRKSRKKISQMELPQKIALLDELAKPFGFFYDEAADVISSRTDAWQRKSGYTAAFDRAAAGAGIVIDALPVYFDYGWKTWLVEFWKGQYGVTTGGEVGVYHTDEVIPAYFYPAAHYAAVEDHEMPEICCRLEHRGQTVYENCGTHWWLTGFRLGQFSETRDLALSATVRFSETGMARAMLQGLRRSGIPREKYRLCGSEICVCMDFCQKYALIARVFRFLVQRINHLNCRIYRLVTRPFCSTPDRLLFLYYQLPGSFRRALVLAGRHGRAGKDLHGV